MIQEKRLVKVKIMAIQELTLKNAKKEARKKLLNIAKKLEDFDFPQPNNITFTTSKSKLNVKEIVKEIPIGTGDETFIYIFKVKGQNKVNNEFIKLLENEKNNQVEKKDFSRINKNNKRTQYLYVGRSHKLKSRISQHLSENYRGTYAMHMNRWCCSINETIEIIYFNLNEIENLLAQAIEDSLWEKLAPCFGKLGDK